MSEDEDYEELPPIGVSCSQELSWFSMPRADELASQRARELQCERDILSAVPVPRSDSESSEGELTAAVRAVLHVAPLTVTTPVVTAAELAAAFAPTLPPAARLLQAYAAQAVSQTLDDMIVTGARAALSHTTDDSETSATLALLCCVIAAGGGGVRTCRVLHCLLSQCTSEACEEVVQALCDVGEPWSARHLLEVSDGCRGGGEAAEHAADVLQAAAARAVVADGSEQQWRQLDASACSTALQLLGRRRARDASVALPGNNVLPRDKNKHPDSLKVGVAATRLQVMFRGGRA